MDATERYVKAKAAATRRAPPPAYYPVHAGIAGAGFAGFVIVAFLALARLPSDAFAIPAIAVIAICYLVPWFVLKKQADRHSLELMREFERLRIHDGTDNYPHAGN